MVFVALFALAFLIVPQWLIIELSVGSRTERTWLAAGWVCLAFGLFGYVAVRLSSHAKASAEHLE